MSAGDLRKIEHVWHQGLCSLFQILPAKLRDVHPKSISGPTDKLGRWGCQLPQVIAELDAVRSL
jgi:hypothetical protein